MSINLSWWTGDAQTQEEKHKNNTRQYQKNKKKVHREILQSEVTDHCEKHNHIMDWDRARIIHIEDHTHQY